MLRINFLRRLDVKSEEEVRERLRAAVANVLYGQERDKATMDASVEEIRLLCWVLNFNDSQTQAQISRYRHNNRRDRD
jgi:hypothetical protein